MTRWLEFVMASARIRCLNVGDEDILHTAVVFVVSD